MIRSLSLGVLVLAIGLTIIGCGGNSPPPKPDMPQTSTKVDPSKPPKTKTFEAGFEDPPKK